MATTDPTSDLLHALSAFDVVDLSLTLDEHKPVSWPGATPFQHHATNTWDPAAQRTPNANGPYLTHTLLLDEHTGTHFDAPSHFIPPPESGLPHAGPAGLITGDRVDLARLMGRAAVIDCRSLASEEPGISPIITPDVVAADEAVNGKLQPGDVVLFWTDWAEQHFVDRPAGDRYAQEPFMLRSRPGWPAPDVEVAQYLHALGVRLLVTDGTSMGPVHDGAPVHWWGLANDMLFVEAATGFSQLPARGAYFLFLPVKTAGSTGGPGRAMAFVPREAVQ